MNAPSDPDAEERKRVRLADFARMLSSGVGIRSAALTVLAMLAILYTLSVAKSVILPIVLAFILSALLGPLVRTLRRRANLPEAVGSAAVLVVLLGVLIFGSTFVVEPASAWMQTIPERLPELQDRLKFLKAPFRQVSEASEKMQALAEVEGTKKPAVVQMRENPILDLLTHQTPIFVANLMVMFVLLYFMLASGDLFLRKLVRLIPKFEDKRRAVEITREIEGGISNYLRTITFINLGLGAAVGLSAWLVGLENFVLWGFVAFILNYIPYLGALIGIAATLAVSLLSFASLGHALLMPGIYLALNILEGNIITPMIMARILPFNPVIVFVSIMFWGWIWGLSGILLAVPLLAILKIVCDHVSPLAPLGEFLGGEPAAGDD